MIRIFSSSLIFLGEIDAYESFSLKRKYYETGTFDLKINAQAKYANLLQVGNIIAISIHKSGMITSYKRELNDSSEETLKISGVTLDGLFKRRIAIPDVGEAYDTIKGNAESIIKHYIENNVTNPSDLDRKIDIFNLVTSRNRGMTLKRQLRYDNLLESLNEIRLDAHIGIQTTLNYSTNKVDVDVYEGVDRTIGNRVIFSTQYDNIQTQEYTNDITNYTNYGYVGGQGEGANRTIAETGISTGIERIETFVDARDIADSNNLVDRGRTKLVGKTETFEAKILEYSTFRFEEHWNLGDLVVVQDKKHNLTLNTRIIEVEETWDKSGYSVYPTFGSKIPTLIDVVKNKLSNTDNEVRR